MGKPSQPKVRTKLTDLKVRSAKPREKPYKITDERGLCLVVMPDAKRYWRYRYRYAGREKMLSVGVYPDTTLEEARSNRDEARALLKKGIDPAEHRREQKAERRMAVSRTFGAASADWIKHHEGAWAQATQDKVRQYLDKDLLPSLARRPLDNIKPVELKTVVERIEARKAFNVAKKTRQWLTSIFEFAIATGLTKNNPAEFLGAVKSVNVEARKHPHLDVSELPALLQALHGYTGSRIARDCALLSLWTANRPGVTRTLRWSELELDNALWTIEKRRTGMKRGYRHLTPLPRQAVAMLRDLHTVTGTFEHVFIGRNNPRKSLSDGAVNVVLKRIGYGGKQTAHGFRHLVSTALNERGYKPDWVERQLAHGDPDAIRGTYNEAHYLEPRREMMQAWADYLDEIRSGAR